LQEAAISRNRFKNETIRAVSVKRKVGYLEDDITNTREKISRMQIDDNASHTLN